MKCQGKIPAFEAGIFLSLSNYDFVFVKVMNHLAEIRLRIFMTATYAVGVCYKSSASCTGTSFLFLGFPV